MRLREVSLIFGLDVFLDLGEVVELKLAHIVCHTCSSKLSLLTSSYVF